MASSSIELWLSGPEASWIVRSLEDVGLEVSIADPANLEDSEQIPQGTDEQIVVVAYDHPLERLRAVRPGPFIVVGWEELSADAQERLNPTLFLPRPIPIARLIRTLRSLLDFPDDSAERPRIVLPDGEPQPLDDAGPPDRAVHLDESDDRAVISERTVQLNDIQQAELPEIVQVREARRGAFDAPEASIYNPANGGLELAPFLKELLLAADGRLFPGEEPLDLRFAVGEEDVMELVPDELLAETTGLVERSSSADPLDAFTFIGIPDLLDTAGGRRNSMGMPSTFNALQPVEQPASQVEVSGETDITREGMLPPGGALRMFWEFTNKPWCRMQIDIAGGDTVVITVREGSVVAMEAPVYGVLARALRAEGVLRELCENEDEARAALDRAADSGRIDRFEYERRLRERREHLIGDLCMASETRFSLNRSPASSEQSLLQAPLVTVATSQVRARLGAGNAFRWLHLDPDSILWLAPDFEERAADARLEPELIAAFERAAGAPTGTFLGGLAATAGAAGALFSLASAGALRFEPGDKKHQTAEALRKRIEQAHALAIDGDYFRILGVPRHATTREIHEAYSLKRRALTHLDLTTLDLNTLEGARREVLETLDDAHDALRNERLRHAYARSLAP